MAETGRIETWQEQVCRHCGNDTFMTLVKLRARMGGGFTTSPGGYACQKCGERADVAQMHRESLRRQRREELLAMEAEDQQQEADAPVPITGNASLRS
jgi:rRNA maturation protein Nop10